MVKSDYVKDVSCEINKHGILNGKNTHSVLGISIFVHEYICCNLLVKHLIHSFPLNGYISL